MNLHEAISQLKLPLEAVSPLIAGKIKTYAELFDAMDEKGGWLTYPDLVVKYFEAVCVKHWADLYFRSGIEKSLADIKDELIEFGQSIEEAIGSDPSLEAANEFCVELLKDHEEALKRADSANPTDSYFSQFDFEKLDVEALTPEERLRHADFWISYHVTFFNDLALATHGESIYSLVQKAVEHEDDDSLVKAVQIDRSLLSYFQDRLYSQSLGGKSDFFDSLAYRLKNPPRRGENKHPLLWILFKYLYNVGCLRRSITSKEILDVYQKAVLSHPKFSIDEELTVQRQRRKFMRLYRQAK